MKVGFIGLGGIGKPMAISIARAGFELTVNDLREQPLKDLERHGARSPARPARWRPCPTSFSRRCRPTRRA